MTGRFVDYSPIPTCQVFFPGRGGLHFHISRYHGVGGMVRNCPTMIEIEVVGICVIMGDGFKGYI